MKSLFDTLNIVYGEDGRRGFVKLNATSLGFTVSGIVFVLPALGFVVVVPIVLIFVGFPSAGDLLLQIGRWPAMYLILTLVLSVIYRYGPSRKAAKWRWITWGGAVAALLWLAGSGLFSWYAANFGKFNETYGSLGAIVGFMTWLWISAIVMLLGAEIDAEMEHQTARDTRRGRRSPWASEEHGWPTPLARRLRADNQRWQRPNAGFCKPHISFLLCKTLWKVAAQGDPLARNLRLRDRWRPLRRTGTDRYHRPGKADCFPARRYPRAEWGCRESLRYRRR